MLIFNFPNSHYTLCSPFFCCMASLSLCIFSILSLFSLLCCFLFPPLSSLAISFLPPKRWFYCHAALLPASSKGVRTGSGQKPFGPFYCRVDFVAEIETLGFLRPGSWSWGWQKEKTWQRRKGIAETTKMKLPKNSIHISLLSQLDDLSELARV